MGIATATGGWALNDLYGDDNTLVDGTGWPGAGEGVGVGSGCFLVAAGAATDGPAAVGRRAGLPGLEVPRGHIQIDDRRGTAWVNDEDWRVLPDSPQRPGSPGEGIAGILGGADNDDALWLHPFTDHDGERKVLAWRSPNQVGEYVILRPTANSHALPWTTSQDEEGEREVTLYPEADSRKLPPRVDLTDTAYLGLVDSSTAGGLGEGKSYSVAVIEAAIERAIANQGALGMTCNSLILNKALYGGMPAHPPTPLEEIIDSAVKTGADLSPVVLWNYANTREILESRIPIPALLHKRLSVDWNDKENRPPLPRTSGVGSQGAHWLDRLEAGVRGHIRRMEQQREALVVHQTIVALRAVGGAGRVGGDDGRVGGLSGGAGGGWVVWGWEGHVWKGYGRWGWRIRP